MQNHTDLRIRRTKAALREALIDLISEKGFDTVTVGEIAERAMINRATFYRHYQDKYELVASIFQENVDTLINELGYRPDDMETIARWHTEAWIKFFEHFARHARLYKAMLGRRGSTWYTAQMIDYLKDSFYKHAQTSNLLPQQKSENHMPLDFVLACQASWLVSVLTWWLENGAEYSPKQIAVWSSNTMSPGIHHAMGFVYIPE